MARKRMFDSEIISQDSFLDLPMEAKALYFLLGMEADDEGFVSYRKVLRLYGGTEDSIRILAVKGYIIPFKSGVIVITDWRRNNYLDKNRITKSIHENEKKQIILNIKNGKYELIDKNTQLCLTDVKQTLNQNSIEENSIEENRVAESRIDNNKKANESCVDDLQEVIDFYSNNIGMLTPYGLSILEDYSKQMPNELIVHAIKKAVEANVRTIQYIKGILNSWNKKGIKTLIEAEEEDYRFRHKNENNETQEDEIARRTKELEECSI